MVFQYYLHLQSEIALTAPCTSSSWITGVKQLYAWLVSEWEAQSYFCNRPPSIVHFRPLTLNKTFSREIERLEGVLSSWCRENTAERSFIKFSSCKSQKYYAQKTFWSARKREKGVGFPFVCRSPPGGPRFISCPVFFCFILSPTFQHGEFYCWYLVWLGYHFQVNLRFSWFVGTP